MKLLRTEHGSIKILHKVKSSEVVEQLAPHSSKSLT